MLISEQESMEWMRDLMSKFSKSGELVLNNWSGTSATEKACLQLSDHCRFVGCEKTPHVFRIRCCRFRIYTDIVESKEVVDAREVSLVEWAVISSRRRINSWTVPAGLISLQTFPAHMKHFL